MTVELGAAPPAWLGQEEVGREEVVGLVAIVTGFLLVAGAALWLRAPLGHDESVYALRSRDLADGWSNLSGGYWADYRAPGLPVFLRLAHGFGDIQVTSARFVVVLLGASTVAGTWWLGRLLAGRLAGLIAAALTASSLGFMVSSTTLLADVPGAAFVLPAVACYLVELRGGVLRWSFLVVPTCAFLGTLARFGVPLMLASGLVAVSLPYVVRAVRRRSWTLWIQVAVLAVAVGLTCALIMVTEFVSLSGQTPVDANRSLVGGKDLTVATGFADLREVVNPWADGRLLKLWSPYVAVLVLVGGVLAVVGAAMRRVRRDAVLVSFVAAAFSLFAIVASIGQVQANYLVLSLPYWGILAGIGLAWPIETVLASPSASSTRARPAVGAVFVLVVALLFVDVARSTRDQHQQYEVAFGRIRSASVGADEAFDDCFFVTSYTPQVGYYSRCKVVPFVTSAMAAAEEDDERERSILDAWLPASLERGHELFDADDLVTGVFVVESGKRQPPDADFDSSELLEEERLFEHGVDGEGRRHAWVQLLDSDR